LTDRKTSGVRDTTLTPRNWWTGAYRFFAVFFFAPPLAVFFAILPPWESVAAQPSGYRRFQQQVG
jgi:hypothetical protein